jgi:hypothetical protein
LRIDQQRRGLSGGGCVPVGRYPLEKTSTGRVLMEKAMPQDLVSDEMENVEPVPSDEPVASLRGAAAAGDIRKAGPWFAIGTGILLVVIAVVVLLGSLSDRATTNRLKSEGIHVSASVTECIGNLGGSGSNSAGFTCHGRYVVRGGHYEEVISGLQTFAPQGTKVAVIADPQRLSTIETVAQLEASTTSMVPFVVSGALLLAGLGLGWVGLRSIRRRSSDVEAVATTIG